MFFSQIFEDNVRVPYQKTPEEMLGFTDLPSYEQAQDNPKDLRTIAEALFGDTVYEVRRDTDFSYPSAIEKAHVTLLDGSQNAFYYKESWEGPEKEVLGMALANLFLGETYQFVADPYNSILATVDVGGKIFSALLKDYSFSLEETKGYGKALALANLFTLNDRHDENLILKGDNILHIDFADLFSYEAEAINQTSIGERRPQNTSLVNHFQNENLIVFLETIQKNEETIEDLVAYFDENVLMMEEHPLAYMRRNAEELLARRDSKNAS